MPKYSIKDLENLTGIQAHTIRVWEQRYHLFSPERTPTNFRKYSDDELRKLLSIALLNNNGMKISKIAVMTDNEIAEAVLQLSESDDSTIENHIENLKLTMVAMNEAKFEKLFGHILLQMGFEKANMKIFIPLFKRLVFLWQTGSVTMAQINFISSIYKQKLYVAIDGLMPPERSGSDMFILFLPQTEQLETGLLFCNYLLKNRGFHTLYLGASLPAEELVEILEKNPTTTLLSIPTLSQIDLTNYYSKVLTHCNDEQKLIITGNQITTVKITDPRLTIFQDIAEFRDYLDGLSKE